MTTRLQETLQMWGGNELLNNTTTEVVEGVNGYTNSAACLFPVAARSMVEDGIEPKLIAHIMMEAAYEALYPMSDRVNPEMEQSASSEILRLALEYQNEEWGNQPN